MADEDNDPKKCIPDADRELALKAQQSFEIGKYDQSMQLILSLRSKRTSDVKVYHNIAVLEYCMSNYQMTKEFKRKLHEVCKQFNIDMDDLETVDDVDNCVILYNQALIHYHCHDYQLAINLLDKVIQFIEPMEETLAKRACFLLIECYLCIYQPKKALSLTAYIETNFLTGCRNGNRSSERERENQKEDKNGNGISELLKRKLQLYKARCYAMLKTSKACKKEIKMLMSTGSQAQNIPVFYLKSQLEYQRGNYRKALKLLNSVTLPEDISKYFRKTGDCLPAIFYNNVGCIHFYMGKPCLGYFYTNKALQAFNAEIKKINARPLLLMSPSTKHQLIYNMGLQYLQARKFKEAFNCFVEAVETFYTNPRLWLRIAECCIQIQNPDCFDQYTESGVRSFMKSIVGVGPHRKLILHHPVSEKIPVESGTSFYNEAPSLQLAMQCLKNALFLVGEHPSSVTEIPSNLQLSSEETESSNGEEVHTLSVLPSNFLQGTEVLSLRNSILASSSYVSLAVGDVIPAHEYAKTLLSQPRISAAHKFLAHMYAGESLLVMDRITEAVEHLNFTCPDQIELAYNSNSSEISLKHQLRFDIKSADDGSRPVGNVPNWLPNTISSAKFVIQYNLAVTYAVREEWTKALECLLQLGNIPPQALSLLIYVQSHQGTAEDTKSYVQKCAYPVNA